MLFKKKFKFLRRIVSEDGIEPDPEKVQSVTKWPHRQTSTEVRAFAAYYRKHIRSFAEIVRPLYDLTKKNVHFHWGSQQEGAFQALKTAVANAPVLALPTNGGGYVLDKDANNHSMGCVLQQWQNGELTVIAYASRAFSNTELLCCTSRKELAAVMYGLCYYRHYLLGFPLCCGQTMQHSHI